MAKWQRSTRGIPFIELGFMELIQFTKNNFPICDACLKDLIGYDNLILIPYINEAFCRKCGLKRISDIALYPEDKPIFEKRMLVYEHYFGQTNFESEER